MPEKTPTTTDVSLLSSQPPSSSEIVIDKIPHLPGMCQLKPTNPSGKKRLPYMVSGANFFYCVDVIVVFEILVLPHKLENVKNAFET